MMGGLLAAGIISGAGQAVSQVADTVLDIAGDSLLQKDREDWETKRRAQTEMYAFDREQRGYDQAKGLLAQREAGEDRRLSKTQDFELGRDQQRLGAEFTKAKMHQDYESGEKGKDRTSAEGIHSADRALKEKLGTEENRIKAEYYKALGSYYGQRGAAAGQSGTSAETKYGVEYMKDILNERLKGLHKRLELALPQEQALIESEIEHVMREARQVAGVEDPRSTSKQIIDPDDINDRFRQTRRPASSNPVEARRSQTR